MKSLDKERRKLEKAGFTGQTLERAMELLERTNASILAETLVKMVTRQEKTPSMVVYGDTQSFYCFGCGAGGDVISFIMRIENLGYVEAVKFLAQRVGLEVPDNGVEDRAAKLKPMILEMNRLAARFYHGVLRSPAGKPGQDYFSARQLAPQTIVKYGLGYAPDSWNLLTDHLLKKGFTEEELLLIRCVKHLGAFSNLRPGVSSPTMNEAALSISSASSVGSRRTPA